MSFQNPDRTWKDVNNGSLCDNIQSIKDYNDQYNENQRAVREYLKDILEDNEYLQSEELLEVHRLSFDGLTTFGGKFAQKQMSFGGRVGAPPSSIKDELKLLDKQMAVLWKKAETDDAKIRAIAFQHARLVAIHAFEDGNGRASRITSDYALQVLGKHGPRGRSDRAEYIKANNAAMENNNIGRLAQLFAEKYQMPYSGADNHMAPYKIVPCQNTANLSFDNSRLLDENSINEVAECRGFYLKPSDFDDIIQWTDGKKGRDFAYISDKLTRQIDAEPLTIGASIHQIKQLKTSGAVKPRMFHMFKDDGYLNFAKNRFAFVTQFANEDQKNRFEDLIEKQLNGQATITDMDRFVAQLHSKPPGRKKNTAGQGGNQDCIEQDIEGMYAGPRM